MMTINGIAVIIALLLATLWTLDDTGMRYLNRKDHEVKMIGKYLGLLMPIIFGMYGISSLLESFSKAQVLRYLFKTTVVLYPPFLAFTVFHTHFIRNRLPSFLRKANLETVSTVWRESRV
jgi:hypothetical protein